MKTASARYSIATATGVAGWLRFLSASLRGGAPAGKLPAVDGNADTHAH